MAIFVYEGKEFLEGPWEDHEGDKVWYEDAWADERKGIIVWMDDVEEDGKIGGTWVIQSVGNDREEFLSQGYSSWIEADGTAVWPRGEGE